MQRLEEFEIGTIVHFNAENAYYGEEVYGRTRNLVISGVRLREGYALTYYLKLPDGTDPTRRWAGYVNKAYHHQLIADVFLNAVRKAIQCSHSK